MNIPFPPNQQQSMQVDVQNDQNQDYQGPEYEAVIKQAWFQIKERRRNEELNRLRDDLNQRNKENEKLRIDLAALKAFSDQAQIELRKKSDNRQAFDDLQALCNDYRRQLNQITVQKDEIIQNQKGEIQRLNEVILQYKARDFEVEKYKRGITLIEDQEKKYKLMIKDRDAEIDSLNKRLVKGDDSQYDEFVTRIQRMDKHIEYLQNIITQKDQQIIESKHKIQEIFEHSSGDVSKMEQKYSQQFKQSYDVVLKEKVVQFEKELVKKDEEIQRLNNIRIQLEGKTSILEGHRATMTNIATNNNEVQKMEEKFLLVKKENEELQQLKIHFTEEIQNIRQHDQMRYESQIEQLRNQIQIQGSQLTQQSRDVEALYAEIKMKDQKIQQLGNEIQLMRQTEINVKNRDAEIEGLRATIHVLKKENERLYPTTVSQNYNYEVQNVLIQPEIQTSNNQRMSVGSNGSFKPNNGNSLNNTNNYNGANVTNANSNQTAYFRASLQPNYLQVSGQNTQQQQRFTNKY